MTVKAIYRHGHFELTEPLNMPEGAEVALTISDADVMPPEITDPEERQKIVDELLADMAGNPWPADAPRFTREELHERR